MFRQKYYKSGKPMQEGDSLANPQKKLNIKLKEKKTNRECKNVHLKLLHTKINNRKMNTNTRSICV